MSQSRMRVHREAPADPPQLPASAKRVLLQLQLELGLAMGCAAGLLAWVFFGATLAPLRHQFMVLSTGHPPLDHLLKGAVVMLLGTATPLLALGALLAISAALKRYRGRSVRRAMQQAIEVGERDALQAGAALLERTLAVMRAQGCTDREIEAFRDDMEKIQRDAMLASRCQTQELLDHPELVDVFIEDMVADAQALAEQPGGLDHGRRA